MKFQKGILSDEKKEGRSPASEKRRQPIFRDVDKNRLFETQAEIAGSSSHYLKVLGVVAIVVLVGGGLLAYLMQPGVGDRVKGPDGLEDAIRENFLSVQKRTATDVALYKCDGFYWARVGVETRSDIPNPVYRIDTYTARATPSAERVWNITAQPVTAADLDVPCK